MIFELSRRFFAMFMSVILFFNGLSITLPGKKVTINYEFDNADALSAAGTVSISDAKDGEYALYWGTDDAQKLSVNVGGQEATYSEFAFIDVDNGSGETEIYSFTAIPDGAKTVLAYDGYVQKGVMDLPQGKQPDEGSPLYSFGALSDLHFNRYSLSLTGDDSMITFPNALNFLDCFDISLVGMSGDLSSSGEESSLIKFNSIVSGYDFPVYTSTGNHDVSDRFSLKNWQKHINTGAYGEQKAPGILSVGVNGMDFAYSPEATHGDVFIFFSQMHWDYNKETSRLVTDEQLDWLASQLEAYKDRTVYLFFHTFLANADGNKDTGEGNLLNDVGNTYDLVFTPGTADEVRFTALMRQYKNVVFFNGHSHWAFDMQKYNPILNITDYDGTYATMVHISSVSSPRRTTAKSSVTTEWNMRSSEGYLVKVYDDCIVLTGCDFLKGELLAYATYVIEK